MSRSIPWILGAFLFAGGTAFGEEWPCRHDVESRCGHAIGDRDALHACLTEAVSEFSEECRVHIQDLRVRLSRVAGVCGEDVDQHCDDVSPRGGRVIHCLDENRDDLTPGCRQELARAQREGREIIR